MSYFRGVLLQMIMASLTLQLTINPKAAVPSSEKDKISNTLLYRKRKRLLSLSYKWPEQSSLSILNCYLHLRIALPSSNPYLIDLLTYYIRTRLRLLESVT
jgi:hypothetical protein